MIYRYYPIPVIWPRFFTMSVTTGLLFSASVLSTHALSLHVDDIASAFTTGVWSSLKTHLLCDFHQKTLLFVWFLYCDLFFLFVQTAALLAFPDALDSRCRGQLCPVRDNSCPLCTGWFVGDELAYSKMCWHHESALRPYSIKCSMANAFFIRPGGLPCSLKTQEA